ncbi:hypothetical protein KP509_23G079000 [Ceratopteris richardii]|uniref:Uncharacterized protein n=1 Tax=Ceratopteris richardii TaxID=49495 RepID=A0A8T2S430_CERRI|nr:hypothetical protein KP509_23G079000 [Ceratopteris richardii]
MMLLNTFLGRYYTSHILSNKRCSLRRDIDDGNGNSTLSILIDVLLGESLSCISFSIINLKSEFMCASYHNKMKSEISYYYYRMKTPDSGL